MVYKLLVDYREKKVIDLLNKNSFNEQINYESCNLEIGDFILKNENDEIIFIIERKTLNDLNCSIKDGRYKEQSMRLDCCNLENHNIIYLIEGNLQSPILNCHINEKTIYSTICSLQLLKGFSVIKTINIDETVKFIISYVEKTVKELQNGKSIFYGTVNRDNNNDYTSTIVTTKNKNINKDNIDIIMLSQIPYISALTAKNILQHVGGTLDKLYLALNENINILDNLIIESNEKKRKISKKVIENIKTYLIK
jgi:ERCC4-type nuclease